MNSKWNESNIPDLRNQIIVVTGGTSGVGLADATILHRHNATVIVASRNAQRGQAAVDQIKRTNPLSYGHITFEQLDVSSLANIRAFTNRFAKRYDHLDVLINNAGIMAIPERRESADGYEMQLATDFLGPFALTGRLLPVLQAAHHARVVTVSSVAQTGGTINFADLQSKRQYAPWRAYSQAKLADVMFGRQLQGFTERHQLSITSYIAHPGGAKTNLQSHVGHHNLSDLFLRATRPLLMTPAKAALSTLFAATDVDAVPGNFYGPRGFMHMWGYPGVTKPNHNVNSNQPQELWAMAEKLTGVYYAKMI